jgi:hypothetical protein
MRGPSKKPLSLLLKSDDQTQSRHQGDDERRGGGACAACATAKTKHNRGVRGMTSVGGVTPPQQQRRPNMWGGGARGHLMITMRGTKRT